MRRLLRTPRLAARFTIDGAMVLLLVSSLSFRATGREAHEWIGVLFCVLLALHTIWNWGWYKNLFAGTYNARRAVGTITNLALVAAMTALCVCGVLNSRHIFSFSRFIDGEGVRQIHSFAAYWGLVLVGIHAGLHWDMIAAVAKKTFGGNDRSKSAALSLRVLAIAIAGLGVWASYERDMASKLFLGFSFDFWNPDWPLVFFYACNLAIMGMYAFVAHYARKALRHNILQGVAMKRFLFTITALVLIAGAGSYKGQAMAKDAKETQVITRAGSQASIKGSSDYFTGNVTIQPFFGPKHPDAPFGAGYVTFESGARSFWHTHPTGQHLIVTDGIGRTGTVDGKVEEFRKGDALWCPAGIKHWHGASPTSSMTHLALTGSLPDGKNVTWMEEVTDEQYNSAK